MSLPDGDYLIVTIVPSAPPSPPVGANELERAKFPVVVGGSDNVVRLTFPTPMAPV